MVATNAFGMGIDKSNVRLVIHYHIPSNVESYFQETGRVGRDEKESYAILLYNNNDVKYLQEFVELNYPTMLDIKGYLPELSKLLSFSYINSGDKESFDFNLSEFCNTYKYNKVKVYNSLKYLEKEEYLKLTDIHNNSSRIKIIVEYSELNKIQLNNNFLNPYIKLLLRSYNGLFEDYVKINENILAERSQTTEKKIKEILYRLEKLEIITYFPKNNALKLHIYKIE